MERRLTRPFSAILAISIRGIFELHLSNLLCKLYCNLFYLLYHQAIILFYHCKFVLIFEANFNLLTYHHYIYLFSLELLELLH